MAAIREQFGVSERRACRVTGQARSTQRPPPPVPSDDELALRAFLRDFSTKRPRWGWRRAATTARAAGWRVNDKRIHRRWRAEGLRVPYRKRKKPLRGIGVATGAFCPIRPNVVWALDFQFDQTTDGRMLKLLNVVDEYTRQCPTIDVDRSIDADGVVAVLDRLATTRRAPRYVRFDHGPEFIAMAVADWCRFNGTDTVFIDRGSPPLSGQWHVDRELQRPAPGRVPERTALRQPARSEGPPRGLADRLQHQQAPQRPRLAHPGRVRRGLAQPTASGTRIERG